MTIVHHNWIKWFILAIILIVPLIPFFIIDHQWDLIEHAHQTHSNDFQFYRGDMTLQAAEKTSSEWRSFDSETYNSIRETGTFWFRITLPENLWRNPYMYIVYLQNGDFFLEGQQIYSFNTNLHNDQVDRYQPQLFQLPDDFAGKDLYIRSTFAQQWLHPGIYYIDEPLNRAC